jgi:hypothetical protein
MVEHKTRSGYIKFRCQDCGRTDIAEVVFTQKYKLGRKCGAEKFSWESVSCKCGSLHLKKIPMSKSRTRGSKSPCGLQLPLRPRGTHEHREEDGGRSQ